MKSNIQVSRSNLPAKADIEDFFSVFDTVQPADSFDAVKDATAVELAALIAFSGLKRSDVAEQLGWSKSRVSNVLSGKTNLTLKTIHEICSTVGYQFDLVFHKGQHQSQPWEVVCEVKLFEKTESPKWWQLSQFTQGVVRKQTAQEVIQDFQRGEPCDYYLSVPKETSRFWDLNTIETPGKSLELKIEGK